MCPTGRSKRPSRVAWAPVKTPVNAKELAFDQVGGQGGAVDATNGPFALALKLCSARANRSLLTRSLACQEHRTSVWAATAAARSRAGRRDSPTSPTGSSGASTSAQRLLLLQGLPATRSIESAS